MCSALSTLNNTTEMPSAPGVCSRCVCVGLLLCVCVHFGWVNAEHERISSNKCRHTVVIFQKSYITTINWLGLR